MVTEYKSSGLGALIGNLLDDYLNFNFAHLKNAIDQEHEWSIDTPGDVIHSEGSGRVTVDEIANIPAAAKKGRLFVSTDESKLYYDTGSAWTAIDLLGVRAACVPVFRFDEAVTTGDGKFYWTIPEELDGFNLVTVGGHVYTPSSSGLPTMQIHNLTDGENMLSTAIIIDENENDSKDSATPPEIDTDHDDVATGDVIRFDCDVAGTDTLGFEIRMGLQEG